MSQDGLQESTLHCGTFVFVAFTLYEKKLYILVVFLSLRMVLVIVMVADLKEFAVQSGSCLHMTNTDTSQGLEGQEPAPQGSSGPG